MSFLSKLFGLQKTPTHAVLVHLDAMHLPDAVYERYDLATIEQQLVGALERAGTGEFDGNEIGPGETILFMYGPDGERLFQTVELLLRAYPLCQGARVVIRSGEPGAPEREVKLE